MNITTVGIDLAKNVFQVHGVDARGKAVLRKAVKRAELLKVFVNLPSCLIGLEACGPDSVTPWPATVSRVQLTVVDHPLARARLTRMRDERTDNAAFRAALAELTQMLVYEATRDLPIAEEPITTPVTGTTGYRLAAPPLIVPVLRAGLGMADTAHGMLPESQMGFVGLARNEHTFQPEAYMASLPASLVDREVFVLDPMLATGGSLVHCCGLLTGRGATAITVLCALAAPEGLRRLEESGLPLRVFTASVDERLNESAYIVPGLGDAGDRQFGAV